MLHRGLDFHTVRVVCKRCGWFRNIAHSGCSNGKRALVKIWRSGDPSHILHARVVETPEDGDIEAAFERHPGFRDLVAEARQKGLFALEREFSPLLEGQACPRCKTEGHLELSQILKAGAHVRY